MAKKQKEDNFNKDVSLAVLESCRKALYAVRDFFDNAANQLKGKSELDIDTQLKIQKAILEGAGKLGPAIEGLDKLEDKVKRDEKASIHRKGNAETSLFED